MATGLFGAPIGMRGTLLGGSGYAPDTQPTAPKKGGFFGQGGAGRAIAGTIGDVLLQRGGLAPIFAPAMQYQQAIADKQRLASTDRENDWQNWVRQQQWERANPKPTNNDTVADYEFIRRTLGDEQAQEFLRNKANPPAYRVGPDGQFYRVDVAMPPARPVGRLTPIEEGTGSNAGGNFPGR